MGKALLAVAFVAVVSITFHCVDIREAGESLEDFAEEQRLRYHYYKWAATTTAKHQIDAFHFSIDKAVMDSALPVYLRRWYARNVAKNILPFGPSNAELDGYIQWVESLLKTGVGSGSPSFVQDAESVVDIDGHPTFSCTIEALRAIHKHAGQQLKEDILRTCASKPGILPTLPLPSSLNVLGLNSKYHGVTAQMLQCMINQTSVPVDILIGNTCVTIFISGDASVKTCDTAYSIVVANSHATAHFEGLPFVRGPETGAAVVLTQYEFLSSIFVIIISLLVYNIIRRYLGILGSLVVGYTLFTLTQCFLQVRMSWTISARMGEQTVGLGPDHDEPTIVGFLFAVSLSCSWLLLLVYYVFTPICYHLMSRWWFRRSSRKRGFQYRAAVHRQHEHLALPRYPTKRQGERQVPDDDPEVVYTVLSNIFAHHVTVNNPCVPCQTGTCNQPGPVVIHPGVVLNKRAQSALALKVNLIITPSSYTVHVDCLTDSTGACHTRPLIEYSGLSNCFGVQRRFGKDCPFSLFSLYTSPERMPTEKAYPTKVVDGAKFIFDGKLITMIHPVRDTVPASMFTEISSRLCTSGNDTVKMFDAARTFFQSKSLALKIKVSVMTPWIILLCDHINRTSVSVSPSLHVNLPFNASLLDRIVYFYNYYSGRCNAFSSQPSNLDFDHTVDRFVPAYEVFHPQVNAEDANPRVPEGNQPFPNVRPVPNAAAGAEFERPAGADNPEHAHIDGEPRAGDAAHPQPADHGPAPEPEAEEHILLRPAVEPRVPDQANPLPPGAWVGRPALQRPADHADRFARTLLDFDRNRPIAATITGGACLYLVPLSSTNRMGDTILSWELHLSRNPVGPTVRIYGCYGCVRRDILRFAARDGNAYAAVAGRYREPWIHSECAVAERGLPSVLSCDAARARLRAQDDQDEARQDINANGFREVGLQVPNGPPVAAERRQAELPRRRWPNSQGRNRQVFPQDRVLNNID